MEKVWINKLNPYADEHNKWLFMILNALTNNLTNKKIILYRDAGTKNWLGGTILEGHFFFKKGHIFLTPRSDRRPSAVVHSLGLRHFNAFLYYKFTDTYYQHPFLNIITRAHCCHSFLNVSSWSLYCS